MGLSYSLMPSTTDLTESKCFFGILPSARCRLLMLASLIDVLWRHSHIRPAWSVLTSPSSKGYPPLLAQLVGPRPTHPFFSTAASAVSAFSSAPVMGTDVLIPSAQFT